jgi:hypothetical protein
MYIVPEIVGLMNWESQITVTPCKAIPLQAWTGPEGSRKLRLPYFKTFGT